VKTHAAPTAIIASLKPAMLISSCRVGGKLVGAAGNQVHMPH
jgi:hypothetical protein